MVVSWELFSGRRTNEGKHQISVRRGPWVAHGDFADTLTDALKSAEDKFNLLFNTLIEDGGDLTALLD